MKIKKALISVSDKEGVVEFARKLRRLGIEILSTGGTAKLLESNNIKTIPVSDYTGFPEIMDGRVKTLHPRIHGGILAVRKDAKHKKQMKENEIEFIDMVVVNLYPFEETVKNLKVKFKDAIENIDIGGPSMLRSAAKNHEDVIVICNPERYEAVAEELKKKGNLTKDMRKELAVEVFQHTAHYDAAISKFLEGSEFPKKLILDFEKAQDLRYGENPHQRAAFYKDDVITETCLANAKQLHGKELSYNNILDLNDAFELVKDFHKPTAAVIKHTNPCGVCSSENIGEAYKLAFDADSMSAYGGVVALNRECTVDVAEQIKPVFMEAIIAPSYDDKALKILMEKKNLRIIETGKIKKDDSGFILKKVSGGLLVQTRAFPELDMSTLKVVTKRVPTNDELKDLVFAWKVNKHVKSNSIVFAREEVTVGIGAGQMSRVDSSIIAARKAGDKAKGARMSSDAFFPFRDGIDAAAKAGITAIIQPGGSIRDQEVIDAANEYDIAMVFSGVRLFKH